jgi:hypothetical protein
LDEALHEVVGEIADRARPVNLAGRALATARWRRTVRQALTLTGVAGVVVAAVTVAIVATGPSRGSRPAPGDSRTAAPSPTPIAFDGGALLTVEGLDLVRYEVVDGAGRTVLGYDRTTGRYQPVGAPPPDTATAPAGYTATIYGEPYQPRGVRLTDKRTGKSRNVPINAYDVTAPQWSPDGRTLLVTINDKDENRNGFALVDPAAGTATLRWIGDEFDSYYYLFTWHPDGKHVILALADRSNGGEDKPDKVAAWQLFDLDGRPGARLPVRGTITGTGVWSPSGRYAVVDGVVDATGARIGHRVVVDVATGRTLVDLPPDRGAWWLGDEQLLVAHRDRDEGPTRLDVVDLQGRVLRAYLLPNTLTGNLLAFEPTR